MHSSEVSALNKCQSAEAKMLCIYDIGLKLKSPGQYDIGGTYSEEQSDLWFFYVTSICPGYNYLLNLFVCHRKTGIVSIGVSDGNELKQNNVGATSNYVLPETLSWQIFKVDQPEENSFIKTFCFTEADVLQMEKNTLVIPVAIQINPKHIVLPEVMNRIKLQHYFGDLLFKQEKTDLILKTPSQKQYKTHRIVLAAHSPVLRSKIKTLKEDSMLIDIADNDLEILLEFLYTGTIKDLFKQNCLQLLELADRFQLKNLFLLAEFAIKRQINVNNAVEIAVIAEKYKLQEIQTNIFNFIKSHPQVLESEGWKNLNDISLTKKLLAHICEDSTQDQSRS